MQVHDWIICSLVTVDHRVGVESNNQVVSLLGTFLKEVQMADMEQVELQRGQGLFGSFWRSQVVSTRQGLVDVDFFLIPYCF